MMAVHQLQRIRNYCRRCRYSFYANTWIFWFYVCAHGCVCLDTHMEVRGTGLRNQVSSSFTGALGLNSLVTKRAGQAISPVYRFTFLFRTLHLRILEWKGAWSLNWILKEVMGIKWGHLGGGGRPSSHDWCPCKRGTRQGQGQSEKQLSWERL